MYFHNAFTLKTCALETDKTFINIVLRNIQEKSFFFSGLSLTFHQMLKVCSPNTTPRVLCVSVTTRITDSTEPPKS